MWYTRSNLFFVGTHYTHKQSSFQSLLHETFAESIDFPIILPYWDVSLPYSDTPCNCPWYFCTNSIDHKQSLDGVLFDNDTGRIRDHLDSIVQLSFVCSCLIQFVPFLDCYTDWVLYDVFVNRIYTSREYTRQTNQSRRQCPEWIAIAFEHLDWSTCPVCRTITLSHFYLSLSSCAHLHGKPVKMLIFHL